MIVACIKSAEAIVCVMFLQLLATYHCDQAYAFDISSNGSCSRTYGSETTAKSNDTAGRAAAADLETTHSSATSPSIR